MQNTENLGLQLPEDGDSIDQNPMNANFKILDDCIITRTEVNTALAQKANLSTFVGMTRAEYDALETKTEPLYFIYEDETS